MILLKLERVREKRLYELTFEGKPPVRIHEEVLVHFGLRTGDSVSEESFEALQESEEFVLAKHQALTILGRRVRSEKELRDKLRNKEFHPKAIEQVVEYLTGRGFLDDVRFGKLLTNHILSRKPAGKALLRRELRLKGVSTTVTNDILNETLNERSEEEFALIAARKFLTKKHRSSRKRDEKKEKQQLTAHLAQRGFSWNIIYRVLKELDQESPSRETNSQNVSHIKVPLL